MIAMACAVSIFSISDISHVSQPWSQK